MCLGGEGGVDREVNQDRFTVGLALRTSHRHAPSREWLCRHHNGRLGYSRHWRFDMQGRMWEGDSRGDVGREWNSVQQHSR